MKSNFAIMLILGLLTLSLFACTDLSTATSAVTTTTNNPATTTTAPAVTTSATTSLPVSYDITFNSLGGSAVEDGIYVEGEETSLPEPTKIGYSFDGWFTSESFVTEFSSTSIPNEDITLYAKWTINQYTMTFSVDGGSAVDAITQDYNTNVTEPVEPTKLGFIFGGWYSDSGLTNAYTFSTMPAEDMTIYAKWIIDFTVDLMADDTYKIVGYIGTDSEVFIPSAYMGKAITVIEDYSFFGLNGITTLTIPASITGIHDLAFYNAHGLVNILVDEGSTTFVSENGVLFNIDKTTLVKYPEGRPETSYVIPSSVTSIGNYSFFFNTSLTSMVIPVGVTFVGTGAFMDCSNLATIFIPANVSEIASATFTGCNSLTIYAEAISQPEAWNPYWNETDCPVVWGYIPA